MLASEYKWTNTYIFWELTREQVELYLSAITRRYKKQSDAINKATKKGDWDSLPIDDTSPVNTSSSGEQDDYHIDKIAKDFRKMDPAILDYFHIKIE